MARGQTSQGPWATPNRWAYRLHYRVAQWRAGKGARRFGAHKQPPPPPPATGRRPLLYLSWGRIGDTVLATAVTRHFRAWFDRPIVMVGRPEVEAVVAPHVDRFVAFDQRSWFADDDYRQSFAASIHADYEIVLGDAQYFHGAGVVWNHLVDAVPARHKFVYEGHAPRAAIAPHRPWPRTATVIPSLPKPDPGDLEQRHLWHDLRHYAREVLLTAGIDPGDSLAPPRCRPVLDEIEAVEPTGLPPGPWIACQPFSNNRKKDVSADTWRQVFAAHPTARFLLLGSTAQAAAADRLTGPRVHSLCGRSSVRDSIAVIRRAQLFVGPDSGLTHIAACLGRPTICVSQSANLGTFFPYPDELGCDGLQVVDNPEYRACAGCMTACCHEPIYRTHRRGSLCLRTLPGAAVVQAVRDRLGQLASEVSDGMPRNCCQPSGSRRE